MNYSIRKALSFSLGSIYSSNLLGKRIIEPLQYRKLCKSLLSQLLKFATFGKYRGRIRRHKFSYSKQYIGKGKRTRGVIKSYHTSSGTGNSNSFANLMANIVGKHLRDAKVKAKQNKERRKRDSVMDLSDILFKKKPAAVAKIRRAKKKKVSSPFSLHFNRYLDESSLFKL